MEFYPGFAWAVPRAFGAAVSACRFELGDVLYDDASAYGPSPAPAYHVQLLEPGRSTRSLASESEGQRFFSNWDSPILFEWKDYAQDSLRIRKSSQGRLFSCLWRGEVGVLDDAEAPDPPRLMRDLTGHVETAIPALRKTLRLGPRSKSTHLFAFATDRASDALRSKAASILGLLEARYPCRFADLSAQQAGIDEADRFHPALAVRGIAITAESSEELRDALKGMLYRRAAGAGSDEQVATRADSESTGTETKDRFKLSRHGVFVEL